MYWKNKYSTTFIRKVYNNKVTVEVKRSMTVRQTVEYKRCYEVIMLQKVVAASVMELCFWKVSHVSFFSLKLVALCVSSMAESSTQGKPGVSDLD